MPRDPLPPYKRVAADLRRKIEEGQLLPGEQIPPVPRLCEIYSVSRNTALRAVGVLRDEGLVTVQQGWGAFVAER
jgi:DNA-binding GntR family transcriptional regulator